jgi:hypothetical protein
MRHASASRPSEICWLHPSANERSGTADEVLHDADAAMYRAKNRGKNRFELFEGDLTDPDVQRDTLPQSVGRR